MSIRVTKLVPKGPRAPEQAPGHAGADSAQKVNFCKLSQHRGQIVVTEWAVCTCAAYPFPHRRRRGLCRWPSAPVQQSDAKPGKHGPVRLRGVWRVLARRQGLNPIRHRELIRKYLAALRKQPGWVWDLMNAEERQRHPELENPIIRIGRYRIGAKRLGVPTFNRRPEVKHTNT